MNAENKFENGQTISLKDFSIKIKSLIAFIKGNLITVAIFSLLGALLGVGVSIFSNPSYTATCTFVLEDATKGGGLGQYSGLASLAGISIGGGGDGVFQGENILELYKSRKMIEQALLNNIIVGNGKQLLIERYIDFYHLREKWKNKGDLYKISFNGDPQNFSRLQDSVMIDIVNSINKKVLTVTKPDKKLNIINVEVKFGDEFFAKQFNNKLVSTVNDFYVHTKTAKTLQNIKILQKEADSVRAILNNSIVGVAYASDQAPNTNPFLSVLKAPSQKKQVDVQANTAIYAEVVKNLEISRISLNQETPLIMVIDEPLEPLHKDEITKFKGIVLGMVAGYVISMVFLCFKLIKRIYIDVID